MKNKWAIAGFVACMAFVSARLLSAGDSLYGKVTEVKSADTVLFDYGHGTYVVHIIGVAAPEGRTANQSRDFVAKMVAGKGARVILGSFNERREMYARLLVDDPKTGVRDVGLELVRSGMAQREAQRAQRGLGPPTH